MRFFSPKRRRPSRACSFHQTHRPRFETLENRVPLTAGALDPTFGDGGKVLTDFSSFSSSEIPTDNLAEAVQANGKIIVAGTVDALGVGDYAIAVARYNLDGSLDSSFGGDGRVTIDFGGGFDHAHSVAVQSDGQIVLAGSTDQGAGNRDFAVARLNDDGTLDTTFNGDGTQTIDFGSDDIGQSVELQAGKILVSGYSGSGDGCDFAIARLNSNGTLDNSFDGDGRTTIDFGGFSDDSAGLAVQGDKIVVAGRAYSDATGNDFAVARLNDDGSLDNTFDADGKRTVHFGSGNEGAAGLAVQGDKIVVVGYLYDLTGLAVVAMARLTGDGSLDSTFDGDGLQTIDIGSENDFGYGVAVQGNKIVVAGHSYSETGSSDFAVARLNDNGTLDNTFDGDGRQTIDFGSDHDFGFGVALQGDRIVVSGSSSQGAAGNDFAVARLTNDGALDTSFDGDGRVLTDFPRTLHSEPSDDLGSVVAVQADGKIVVAGVFEIARYNADGSLDSSFGGDGKHTIDLYCQGVAVQGDKIVVVGGSSFGGFAVARLNSDGSLDSTFDGDGLQTIDFAFEYETVFGEAFATCVAVQDDKIVVGGWSVADTPTPSYDFAVARLNYDGTLDTTFVGDGVQIIDFGGLTRNLADFGNSIAVQGDKIVVAGFSDNDFAVARLHDDGTLDTTFHFDGKQTIDFGIDYVSERGNSIAVQGDQIVVAGFAIYQNGATSDFAVARLNYDGTLDNSFDGDGRKTIDFDSESNIGTGVAVQGDRIVLAGYAYSDATGSDFAVARLNHDGTLDTSFDGDGKQTIDFDSASDVAVGVAVQSDGNILVAGYSNQDVTGIDFAVARLIGSPDVDGDGIENSVDTLPSTFSNGFSDVANGGATTGTITNRGDQIITVVDAADSAAGVLIAADSSGGAQPATVSIDGGAANLTLSAGDEVIATHGSVILNVIAGVVEVRFASEAGQTVATASLSAGSELTFEPETVTFVADPSSETAAEVTLVASNGEEATATLSAGNEISFNPDSFSFTAGADNTQTVEVIVNGTTLSVAPGSSVQPVQIDIRPGAHVSSVNVDSNGKIAVAILSSATFDAREVIAASVVFAGASASQSASQDVNGDGRLDLVLHFRTGDTTLRSLYEVLLADDLNGDGVLDSNHQTAAVSLSGETVDEVLIEGFDSLDLFLAGRSLRELLNDLAESGAI